MKCDSENTKPRAKDTHMKQNATRRNFLATAGVAALATGLAQGAEGAGKPVKILGVACSPRKGMTTAKAVEAALDAAKGVDPRVVVELVDLGGLNIAGYSPKPPQDDFTAILPKLQDPALGGLIIGSPSYFRGMSSLCKAFIERCAPLREPKMVLANKPVGVVAVPQWRAGDDDRAGPGGDTVFRDGCGGWKCASLPGGDGALHERRHQRGRTRLGHGPEAGRACCGDGAAAGRQGSVGQRRTRGANMTGRRFFVALLLAAVVGAVGCRGQPQGPGCPRIPPEATP
jgi:hypothetical protein